MVWVRAGVCTCGLWVRACVWSVSERSARNHSFVTFNIQQNHHNRSSLRTLWCQIKVSDTLFFMSLRTRRHLVSYRDPDFRISVGASPSTKYTHLQSTAARRVLAHRIRDRRHHSVPVKWVNLPTTQLGRFATDVQLGPHTDRADHTFDRMWYTSVFKGEGNRNCSFVFNNQKLLMRKGIVRLIESK